MGNSQGYYARMPDCSCIVGAFVITHTNSDMKWMKDFVKAGLIVYYTPDVSQIKLQVCTHKQQVLSGEQLRLELEE